MGSIQRKSWLFRGYLLLEAVFALSVISVGILLLLQQLLFILKADDKLSEQTKLYRHLYEETAYFCRFGETAEKNTDYHFEVKESEGVIVEVSVARGPEKVSIEQQFP